MRHIAITLALGAVLASPVRPVVAQINGGLNLSRFVGGDAVGTAKTKLHLGASVPLVRVGPLSLIPELYYAQRGGDRQLNTILYDIEDPLADFSLNYIEVPILLRLSVNLPGPFAAYFGGGPTYAWQFSCGFSLTGLTMETSSANADCQEPQFASSLMAFANADRGVVGNAGLKLSMGVLGVVAVDFRVVQGLARIIEDQTGPYLRNYAYSMSVSYSLLDNGVLHIK